MLTNDRDTQFRAGALWSYPVAANVRLYTGALSVLDGGVLKPGFAGLGLVAAGRVEARADNTGGAAGAIRAQVRKGVFAFASGADADAITAAHVGRAVYVIDDETVGLTDGGGTRSAAGRVMDVDARGVWVEIV